MFPTIYGVALKGLGPATKFGAAGLVMAIVGGAIMPLVQGKLVDATSAAFSFIVPAVLLRGRRALRALRPQGRAERDRRRARPRGRSAAPAGPAATRRGRGVSRPPRGRGRRGRSRWRWRACGGNSPTSATTSTKQLEVVSWWTSGSEAAALDALFAAFRESNPGVDAVNGAVAGGAGSNAIVELAKRLQHDDPPDVWQTFAGKSVQGYAQPRRGPQRRVGLRPRAICARG